MPEVHAHAIPRLCYSAEDKDTGLYTLDSWPKIVVKAMDRMHYYQHSRQIKSSKPRRDVRQVVQEEAQQPIPASGQKTRDICQRLSSWRRNS